jgi:hypothetical protein
MATGLRNHENRAGQAGLTHGLKCLLAGLTQQPITYNPLTERIASRSTATGGLVSRF